MDLNKTAKMLEGLQTIGTAAKRLGVSRRTAINTIWKLRKEGLVETGYGRRKIRMYRIRTIKKPETGFKGLYDIINENSKVKLFAKEIHKIHDHELTVEEAIVRAVKESDFRTILAALGLFNKIKSWPRLLEFAKKEQITRKIGALYDIARRTIRVKKMDERTRKALLKGKTKDKRIIKGTRSLDFKDIEKEWNVFIPFNKADLEVYKE
ncbi:hypothetical protein HYU07_06415 [Candidatus Woesearchaeota archaeon]|nr:hypothetical protein [Candidatus Woesearchaeota archaeon]